MSGALKSVFGGSGILGSLLSVASMFFPPLAIATSLSNLLTMAIGEAVKMAATTLVKEFGMPKFLEALVNQVVGQALPNLMKPSDANVDAYVGSNPEIKDFMGDLTQDLTTQIIDNTRRHVAEAQDQKEKATGKKGAVGATSWLEAIAMAMGDIMGEKAAKMVELSQKMSDLNASGQEIDKKLDNLAPVDSKLSDKKFSSATQKFEIEKSKVAAEQQSNAREFTKVQTQFQAASQEFSMLSNTFSNAIKSIGEGLTTMGRKG